MDEHTVNPMKANCKTLSLAFIPPFRQEHRTSAKTKFVYPPFGKPTRLTTPSEVKLNDC